MKYLLIVLASLCLSGITRAELVGFYAFENNTLDGSGKSNHGFNETNLGYALGFEGQAALFGGSTFFDVPVNLDRAAAPRATFGAWVNAAVINNPARHEIISTDNGGFDRAIAIDSRNTGGAESGLATYSAFNGNGALLNGSAATTGDGFVFVAAVYNELSDTTRLYVDNQVFTEPGQMSPSQTFTRIGNHPAVNEPFNGLIDNAFMFNRALSATEIDRIRLNGSSAILSLSGAPVLNNQLWSVDIHAVGGVVSEPNPPTKTGVEAIYGDGDIWNAFEVAGHTGTIVDPEVTSLQDSTGAPTTVGFKINGTVSGWSNANADPLFGDYVFVNAGNSASDVTWELNGLTPGNTYELMLYAGSGRVAPMTVDVNGNGSLLDDTTVTIGANNGILFEGIQPDGSGRVIGNFLNNGGETNWSGFQLRDVTVVIPEPHSAALLALGLCLLAALRRR